LVAQATMWNGSRQRVALGHRSATTVAIQLAASALTKLMAAEWVSPRASKNWRSVASCQGPSTFPTGGHDNFGSPAQSVGELRAA
jgi:hypothetical protein